MILAWWLYEVECQSGDGRLSFTIMLSSAISIEENIGRSVDNSILY
jgi:hypothetical protein